MRRCYICKLWTIWFLGGLIGVSDLTATTPDILWMKRLIETGDWNPMFIQGTRDGGYIITSSIEHVVDPIDSYEERDADLVLIKAAADGDELWKKTFGSPDENEQGWKVQQTKEGGYIILGEFRHHRYDELGPYPYLGIWIVKTDDNGNKLWDKKMRFWLETRDGLWDIQQTVDSGYIVVGGIPTEGSCRGAYLVKMDESGNIVWDTTFGGVWENGVACDHGCSVQQTKDKGYIITGCCSGNVWLIKTDTSGHLLWEKTFKKEGHYDGGVSVQQTNDGGYVILTRSGKIIRTDEKGNKIWDKIISRRSGYSIQQTDDGGYIAITGNEVIRTNSLGVKIWSKTFRDKEGKKDISLDFVQQTKDGGYVICGQGCIPYKTLVRTKFSYITRHTPLFEEREGCKYHIYFIKLAPK